MKQSCFFAKLQKLQKKTFRAAAAYTYVAMSRTNWKTFTFAFCISETQLCVSSIDSEQNDIIWRIFGKSAFL